MNDIDPVQPVEHSVWPAIARRRRDEESEPRHDHRDENPGDDETPEDDDGRPHIDVRV